MSTYCVPADLLTEKTAAELIQVADYDGDGAADTDILQSACDYATTVINALISPRYAVPMTTVPDALKSLAIRMAVWKLYQRRDSLTDALTKQHDEDMDFLRRVSKGDISLGDPVNAGDGAPAPGVRMQADCRKFSRDEMKGW